MRVPTARRSFESISNSETMVSKRALPVEADNFSAQIAGLKLSGFVIPFLGLALLLSRVRTSFTLCLFSHTLDSMTEVCLTKVNRVRFYTARGVNRLRNRGIGFGLADATYVHISADVRCVPDTTCQILLLRSSSL